MIPLKMPPYTGPDGSGVGSGSGAGAGAGVGVGAGVGAGVGSSGSAQLPSPRVPITRTDRITKNHFFTLSFPPV